MRNTHSTTRGFTIIELIVAVMISVVMLFLINVLFTDASNAVSIGVATSDVIGNARAVGDQIDRDGQAMVGPSTGGASGGVLVIVCQKISTTYHKQHATEATRDVRSDQAMWIRDPARSSVPTNPTGSQPLCPSGDGAFGPPSHLQMSSATFVRVWYGHVVKTAPNGGSAAALGTPLTANAICNQWAMGRQALFLVNESTDINGNFIAPKTATDYPAVNRVEGAWHDAVAVGITHPNIAAGSLALYKATTDVANFGYADVTHPVGTMVALEDGSGASPSRTLYSAIAGDVVGSFSNATYQARALDYMFLTQRLWANPAPAFNQTDPTKSFTSGEMAQMHPVLADHVSDFIVEFAGDYVDSGGDGVEDGAPDVYTGGVNVGEIIWYGLANNDASGSQAFPDTMPSWYPVPVLSPKTTNVPGGNGGVAFVFRHDYPKMWPYLIRIRYRMHDRRGDLLGNRSPEKEIPADAAGNTGTNIGKWFEQIIVVKRG